MKILFVIVTLSFFFCNQLPAKNLEKLEKRALKEMEYLNFPARENWIPPRFTKEGEKIYNVVIVGGGQSGIALSFALMREKISDCVVFDESPIYKEGCWISYARMDTLRSPKYLIGPDNDIPSLTVRAWYQAKYGKKAWDLLEYIPRVHWAEYLQWLRTFLHLPIVNDTKVGQLKWSEEEKCFIVPITTKGQSKTVFSRKIILATGLHGSGEWIVPDHIKKNIPYGLYYHTSDEIDFSALKGKKIGILGAGPSALDSALLACQKGAKEVHLFLRRPYIVDREYYPWAEFVGFLGHFVDLPDEAKWPFLSKIYEVGNSPTEHSADQAFETENIFFHYESPWIDSKLVDEKPTVVTPSEEHCMDLLIVATGWVNNLEKREELKAFSDKIALWADKFVPPKEMSHKALLSAPYLGKGFNFTEKCPGQAPYVQSIFTFTGGASVSYGFNAGNISSIRYGIRNLVYEVVRQLFVEDVDYYYESFSHFED